MTKLIINHAFKASTTDLVDHSFPLQLLEDYIDMNPSWKAKIIFRLLEGQPQFFSSEITSTKGKGLVLLRICNDILRRVPKSSDSAFCGEILLFLSKIFPSSERSGVNLRGNLNLDNTTIAYLPENGEELPSKSAPYSFSSVVSGLSKGLVPDKNFFKDFWKLQFFYLHPIQAVNGDNWKKLTNILEIVVGIFEKTKCVNEFTQDQSKPDEESSNFPKYVPSLKLFNLQLVDFKFRQVFVIETIIFLVHILAFGSKEELKPSSIKGSNENLLTAEMENWISDMVKKMNGILSSLPDGRRCFKLIRWVIKNDRNWMKWKFDSCPPFAEHVVDFALPNSTHSTMIFHEGIDSKMVGSEELSRLWNQVSSLNDYGSKLVLSEFLEPLKEQMADDDMEPEYRMSGDPIFVWKSLRLALRDEKIVKLFGQIKTGKDLEDCLENICSNS